MMQEEEEEQYRWWEEKNHMIILSNAGKPIFCYPKADEEMLVSLTGFIQAIVSSENSIETIQTGDRVFVFQLKPPVYLLAISQAETSVAYLRLQLDQLYNQILFVLTQKGLSILETKPSYDLRELLGGTDGTMEALIQSSYLSPHLFMESFQCIRFPVSKRAQVSSILAKSKRENLLYSILFHQSKVVSLIQPKSPALLVPDLLLLSNFVTNSTAFRSVESWTPICLPHFNPTGFLYAYVADLSHQLCLVLISAKQSADQFHALQSVKRQIVYDFELKGLAESLCSSITNTLSLTPTVEEFRISYLVHFVFQLANLSQYITVSPSGSCQNLMLEYAKLHETRNLDRIQIISTLEYIIVGIVTEQYCLYTAFDPFVERSEAMRKSTELLRLLRKEQENLFMYHVGTWSTSSGAAT